MRFFNREGPLSPRTVNGQRTGPETGVTTTTNETLTVSILSPALISKVRKAILSYTLKPTDRFLH